MILENKENFNQCAGPAMVALPQEGAFSRVRTEEIRFTLSKTHIRRPKVIYSLGGGLLKTTKGIKLLQVGGGKRSKVSGFSKGSRLRMLYTIARIKIDAELPLFVTLTYPKNFPTIEQAKRDLKIFNQRLLNKFSMAGEIWKLEPQERGAPHYHMMVWGVKEESLFRWVCDNWWDIAGQDDQNALLLLEGALEGSKKCVEKVRTRRGVIAYVSKYLGKTFDVSNWEGQWTGRYWGLVGKSNIPFGQEVSIDLPEQEIIQWMRYQRRASGIKGKDRNSLTIFCDADQWIRKLSSADKSK